LNDGVELRIECKDNRIHVFGDRSLNATLETQDYPEHPIHVESSGSGFALPTIPVQQGIKRLVADTDHFTVIVIPRMQEKE
jgi:hypothetical protein